MPALWHTRPLQSQSEWLAQTFTCIPVPSPASGPVTVAFIMMQVVEHHFICEGHVCRFCGSDSREDAWDIVEQRLKCQICYNADCGGLACPCGSNPSLRLQPEAESAEPEAEAEPEVEPEAEAEEPEADSAGTGGT